MKKRKTPKGGNSEHAWGKKFYGEPCISEQSALKGKGWMKGTEFDLLGAGACRGIEIRHEMRQADSDTQNALRNRMRFGGQTTRYMQSGTAPGIKNRE